MSHNAATPLNPVTGSKKLEAAYDYQGRRVSKAVFTYNAGSWERDTTKTFVYDGWNVIQEHTNTGSQTTTEYYVWGVDVSGSLQGAGGIGGLLLWKKDAGTFLYLYDANGNVGQLVNAATGALAARYEYDPFGNTLVADGSEAENNTYRFSTKPYDAETGLYSYIFRPYSPKLGRWWTRDPIEEAGGVNLYAFVRNAPTNSIDPFGLAEITNQANANMTIVLLGSEMYDWYTRWFDGHLPNGCCTKTKDSTQPVAAIPFPLSHNQTAKPGQPFQDIDAVIQIDGMPYKVGGVRKALVTGGPPPTPLEIDVKVTINDDLESKLFGKHGYGYVFWENLPNPPNTDILGRCNTVLGELRHIKTRILDAGCSEDNASILERIDGHIHLVEMAKSLLATYPLEY